MKSNRILISSILVMTVIVPVVLFSMGLFHYSELIEISKRLEVQYAEQAIKVIDGEYSLEQIGRKFLNLSEGESELIKSFGLMKLTMIFALIATSCAVLVQFSLLRMLLVTHNQKLLPTAEKRGGKL